MAEAPRPTESPSEPRRTSPSHLATAGGSLALVAAVLTFVAGFLPVLEDTTGGQSIGFFDCGEVPGCAWLGLWIVGAAVALGVGGVLAVSGLARTPGGVTLAAGGLCALGFLGWAGFLSQDGLHELGVSLGPGPYLGIVGGLLGLAAGAVLLSASIPARLKIEPVPALERGSEARVGLALAGVLGLVAAAGVTSATFLPYVRLPGDDLSVASCGQEACAWFAVEPLGLAIGLLALSVLSAVRVLRPGVAAALFAVAGIWAVLLFGGYAEFATNSGAFGTDSSAGPAGWIGIVAGIIAIVGAFVAWRVRPKLQLQQADALFPPAP